ncbi:MAG TPA: helix-turn-helix transcriptional regulator [Thermomicrobiales bacterium]|nr:helix-turn-helix transcriptional regulator [Thermomicrobiales bacterium]
MHDTPPGAERVYRQAAGAVLRRLRTEAGWSLREFAERVGVAHTSLHAIERGETTPTMDTLARVAAARGLSFPAILALTLDEIISTTAVGAAPLSSLLESAATLSAEQVEELMGFAEYVKHRDRDPQAG